jgi:hypothetical protein
VHWGKEEEGIEGKNTALIIKGGIMKRTGDRFRITLFCLHNDCQSAVAQLLCKILASELLIAQKWENCVLLNVG